MKYNINCHLDNLADGFISRMEVKEVKEELDEVSRDKRDIQRAFKELEQQLQTITAYEETLHHRLNYINTTKFKTLLTIKEEKPEKYVNWKGREKRSGSYKLFIILDKVDEEGTVIENLFYQQLKFSQRGQVKNGIIRELNSQYIIDEVKELI